MEIKNEVVLYGTWYSSLCDRVKLALKIKGIPFKYVEEDLLNKSQLLLSYNPVHKKVPVLVHKGKPIVESLIILEYIDEIWSYSPKLLPEGSHEKSKFRFWAQFHDQKVIAFANFVSSLFLFLLLVFNFDIICTIITYQIIPGIFGIILSKRNEREKAIEDLSFVLRSFEEGIHKDFPGNLPFFDGENLTYLGIVASLCSCNYEAIHEAVVVFLNPEKNPTFLSWTNALKEHPLIKEIQSLHHKLVARINLLKA